MEHKKEALVVLNIDVPGVSTAITSTNSKSYDPNEISDSARDSNTSFEYSGRHDFGALPQLKKDGAMGDVIASIIEVKESCDILLTKLIGESLVSRSNVDDFDSANNDSEIQNSNKRARTSLEQ